jgi:hypothetical protein
VRNCDFNGVTGDKKTGDLNSYTGRFRNVTYDQMKINGTEVAAPADRL